MGSNPTGFTVRTDVRNGVARLALFGELDMAVAPILDDELRRVEGDGVDSALVDMGELTFIDSSGLSVLLRAAQRAKKNGHDLAVVSVGPAARRVLAVSGTDEFLLDERNAAVMIQRFTDGAANVADIQRA